MELRSRQLLLSWVSRQLRRRLPVPVLVRRLELRRHCRLPVTGRLLIRRRRTRLRHRRQLYLRRLPVHPSSSFVSSRQSGRIPERLLGSCSAITSAVSPKLWTTPEEQIQHLTLSLEGQAAEVLKDFDDSLRTAIDDLWERLSHRLGDVDECREAMRKFQARRQPDTESLVEFE